MAVYAAMVHRVDQQMGRLLGFLEEKGALDNTVIMFCSDNGGCPFERSRMLHIPPWEGGSFLLYDASWAAVSNTPLLHYKQTQHEGGISTPMIIHWPEGLASPGRWEETPGHLVDVMATCLDLGGATYPDRENVEPLQGLSLLPFIQDEERAPHDELYFVFSSCRALRQGKWKLVSFYGHQWELYDLEADRFEQRNLAVDYPERVQVMATRWHELAEHTDRLPENKRKPVKEGPVNYWHHEWHKPELTKDWKPF
jgi:arylsulfatase